jgi:predicted peptidase
LYGLSLPDGFDPARPRPLIVALHPGGGGTPYYGLQFMESVVMRAAGSLKAIIVAPDAPARGWNDPKSERAVLALVSHIVKEFKIDEKRQLVTGFSMGGHGTWFFESRHPELFSAAIVMAGSTRNEPVDRLARIPTYIIHGREDKVVPFGPAEANALELEKLGRPVKFEALDGVDHYSMGGYINALTRAMRWVAERWNQ